MFTRGIGSWWPLETLALHPGEVREVVWEEREGGEVYEISTGGERSHWATVLAWEPPSAFTIAWKVDPDGRRGYGDRGAIRARGRRDAGRAGAPSLGAARRERGGGAGQLRRRLGDGARRGLPR